MAFNAQGAAALLRLDHFSAINVQGRRASGLHNGISQNGACPFPLRQRLLSTSFILILFQPRLHSLKLLCLFAASKSQFRCSESYTRSGWSCLSSAPTMSMADQSHYHGLSLTSGSHHDTKDHMAKAGQNCFGPSVLLLSTQCKRILRQLLISARFLEWLTGYSVDGVFLSSSRLLISFLHGFQRSRPFVSFFSAVCWLLSSFLLVPILCCHCC